MQEPYAEGLATHGDPEPCTGTREDDGEASEGAHVGRVLSREISFIPECRRRGSKRKATRPRARRAS
jgi:hypothetical protein